jgi:response regulator of citrate/malate metabolism
VLKALIVDDEPKLAEVLALKIRDHTPQLKVVGKAQNISDARAVDRRGQAPDVVFPGYPHAGRVGISVV